MDSSRTNVMSWTWLRTGNLKRESESLLITCQKNSQCLLYRDSNETVNHIISE